MSLLNKKQIPEDGLSPHNQVQFNISELARLANCEAAIGKGRGFKTTPYLAPRGVCEVCSLICEHNVRRCGFCRPIKTCVRCLCKECDWFCSNDVESLPDDFKIVVGPDNESVVEEFRVHGWNVPKFSPQITTIKEFFADKLHTRAGDFSPILKMHLLNKILQNPGMASQVPQSVLAGFVSRVLRTKTHVESVIVHPQTASTQLKEAVMSYFTVFQKFIVASIKEGVSGSTYIIDIIECMSSLIKSTSVTIKQLMTGEFLQVVYALVAKKVKFLVDNVKVLFSAMMGLVFRYLVGYSTASLVMETMFALYQNMDLGNLFVIYQTMHDSMVKPQNTNILSFFATFMLFGLQRSTGIKESSIRNFVGLNRLATGLVPRALEDLLAATPWLSRYWNSDLIGLLRTAPPKTFEFFEAMQRIGSDTPKLFEKRRMRILYMGHMYERKTMPLEMIARIDRLPRMANLPDWLRSSLPKDKPQPKAYFFYSEPGHGKSHFTSLIKKTILKVGMKLGFFPPAAKMADINYNYCNTKHWDGYMGQMIVTFDDFLQQKEKEGEPGPSEMLLRVINTAVFFPPMANLLDKGMVVNAALVLGTTNLTLSSWARAAKSMACPTALLRRVHRFYTMEAKNFSKRKGQIDPVEGLGIEQWDFKFHDDVKNPDHTVPGGTAKDIIMQCVAEYFAYDVEELMGGEECLQEIADEFVANHSNDVIGQGPSAYSDIIHRPIENEDCDATLDDIVGAISQPSKFDLEDLVRPFTKEKEREKEEEPGGVVIANVQMKRHRTTPAYQTCSLFDFGSEVEEESAYDNMTYTKEEKLSIVDPKEFDGSNSFGYLFRNRFTNLMFTTGYSSSKITINSMFRSRGYFESVKPIPEDCYDIATFMSTHPDLEYDGTWENATATSWVPRWNKTETDEKLKELDTLEFVLNDGNFTIVNIVPMFAVGVTLLSLAGIALASIAISRRRLANKEEELKKEVEPLITDTGAKYHPMNVLVEGVEVPVYVAEPQVNLMAIKRKQQMLKTEAYKRQLFSTDKRLSEQLPSLWKSQVTVNMGSLETKGFMVSENELIVVAHFFDDGPHDIHIRSETDEITLRYTLLEQHYRYSTDEQIDLAYVVLYNAALPSMRTQISKMADTTAGTICDSYFYLEPRNACTGPFFGKGTATVKYEVSDTVAKRNLIAVDRVGCDGDCGGLYYAPKGNSPERLLGFHTSGAGNLSYFAPLTQSWVLRMRETNHHSPLPVMQVVDASPQTKGIDIVPFVIGGELETKRTIQRTPKITFINQLEGTGVWARATAPAVLGHMGPDRIPPEKLRFQKIYNAHKRNQGCSYLEQMPVTQLATLFGGIRGSEVMDIELTFDRAIQSDPARYRKSIDRSKSAGLMCMNLSKWLLMDVTCNMPVLNVATKENLAIYEDKLYRGEQVVFPKNVTLKDEKLPLAKTTLKSLQDLTPEEIEKVSTRIFSSDDAYLFFLCRKYFEPLNFFIAKYGKVFGIMANTSPDEQADHFVQFMVQGPVLAFGADVEKQDASHTLAVWIALMQLCLLSGIFENYGSDKKTVHPNLPPLNKVNVIRFRLMYSMAMCPWVYRSIVFYIFGMLSSGCYLTFLLNSISSLLGFVIFINRLSGLLKMPFEQLWFPTKNRLVQPSIFGDDQKHTFAAPLLTEASRHGINIPALYVSSMLSIGYVMTSHDKSPKIQLEPTTQVPFCGRQLILSGPRPRMCLEKWRIVKAVQYIQGDYKQHYGNQLSTFFNEALYYPFEEYKDLIKGLKMGSSKFSKIMPCLKKKQFYNVSQQGMCVDDEMHIRVEGLEWFLANYVPVVRPQMMRGVLAEKVEQELEANVQDKEMPTHQGGVSDQDESLTTVAESAVVDKLTSVGCSDDFKYSIPFEDTRQHWSRPIKIAQLTWVTAHARDTTLLSSLYPSAYFDNNYQAQTRLVNTHSFRGTIVVNVMLNSVATQVGAIVVYASPMARVPLTTAEAMTGPHTVINAGENSSVELRIPWSRDWTLGSMTSYFNTGAEDAWFNFVTVGMMILSPINAATATQCEIMVYASIEDSEIMHGALTNIAITPQVKFKKLVNHAKEAALVSAGSSVSPEAMVTTVGGIAETVGPPLAELALCGLSKPDMANNLSMYTNKSVHYMVNADGVDASIGTGVWSTAKTMPNTDEFSSNIIDPMDVNAVCARPGLLGFAVWTELQAINSQLFKIPVQPGLRASAVQPLVVPPVTAVSSLFGYSRGTYVFRLRLYKNAFHSGVLAVVVGYGNMQDPTTDARMLSNHRVLMDITLRNELVIKVPFVRNMHFAPFSWAEVGDSGYGFGPTLYVYNQTKLVRSSSVSDDIELSLEVWGEDMAFLEPCLQQSFVAPAPFEPKPGPMVFLEKGKEEDGVIKMVYPHVMKGAAAQVGPFDVTLEHESNDIVILAPSLNVPKDLMTFGSRYAAGDIVTNLRVLLKRFERLADKVVTVASGETNMYSVKTDWLGPMAKAIASFFVMGTGGVRLKLIRVRDGNEPIPLSIRNSLANDSEGSALHVICQDRDLAEINVVNSTQQFKYLLDINRFTRDVFLDPISTELTVTYLRYVAGADDLTFGGVNYMRGIYGKTPKGTSSNVADLPV